MFARFSEKSYVICCQKCYVAKVCTMYVRTNYKPLPREQALNCISSDEILPLLNVWLSSHNFVCMPLFFSNKHLVLDSSLLQNGPDKRPHNL